MALPNPNVEAVLPNVYSKLGEGPHWIESTQTLMTVDIPAHQVHRYHPETGEHEFKQLDAPVGFIVPRQAGDFIIGIGLRLAQYSWDSNVVNTIHEVPASATSPETSRFNDGKCDPKGRVWAGTYTMPAAGDAVLYSLDVDRTLKTQQTGITVSNGLCWTADHRTMFYVDSEPAKRLYAYDYDINAGTIANQRVVKQYPSADTGLPDNAVPDGMTIDTDGKLWVAHFNGAAVCKMDPETGKVIQKVDLPAKQITSVSWGGRHLDELYVTSARSFPDAEMQNQPLAGSLFKITGLGARGRSADVYKG